MRLTKGRLARERQVMNEAVPAQSKDTKSIPINSKNLVGEL